MTVEQTTSTREAKEIIIDVGMKCWQKGWVAANDGNISWRQSDDEVLCTPTGVSKGMLKMEHICTRAFREDDVHCKGSREGQHTPASSGQGPCQSEKKVLCRGKRQYRLSVVISATRFRSPGLVKGNKNGPIQSL